MLLTVKNSVLVGCEKFTINVLTDTVNEVIDLVQEKTGVPVDQLTVTNETGYTLRSGTWLREYRVKDGYKRWTLEHLASWYCMKKKNCRNCYGRVDFSATKCPKASCGRPADLRPRRGLIPRRTGQEKLANSFAETLRKTRIKEPFRRDSQKD